MSMSLPTRFEERLLQELRTVVATQPAPSPTPVVHRPARRGRLAAGGLAVAAVAAGALVVALGAGGGVVPSAFAVKHAADGTVTVQIHSLRDAAGLERGLRAAGVPAEVEYAPESAPACRAPKGAESGVTARTGSGGGPSTDEQGVPAAGGRGKVTSAVRVGDDGVTFTIDPGTLKTGDKVFITTSDGTVSSIAMSIGTARAPGC
jgi:hypothetical protein